jgi:hypothetical protein
MMTSEVLHSAHPLCHDIMYDRLENFIFQKDAGSYSIYKLRHLNQPVNANRTLEVGILCEQLRHFLPQLFLPLLTSSLSFFFESPPGPGRSSPKDRCNSKNKLTRDAGNSAFLSAI